MLTSTNASVVFIPAEKSQTIKSKELSKLSILLVCFASFSLIVLVELGLSYGVHWYNISVIQKQKVYNDELCSTQDCIEAAIQVLQNMDATVNPCENFYEFSCGSWMKNREVSSNNIFSKSTMQNLSVKRNNAIVDLLSSLPPKGTIEPKAITNARRLYKSCINEYVMKTIYWDGITHLIKKEFNGWPDVLESAWNESMFSLSQILLKWNQYNSFSFYHVVTTIDYDFTNTLQRVIQISPGYRPNDHNASFTDKNSLTEVFQRVTQNILTSDLNTTLFNFTQEIEKYLLTPNGQKSSENTLTTVRNLSQTIDTTFDFSNYVRRLYLLGNVTLTDDDIIVVSNIDFIRNISSTIAQQPPEIIQYYIIAQIIRFLASDMKKQNRTTSDEELRTITCAISVNENMPFAVSKLYIDKYYDKLASNEVIKIVQNIRNTSIDMINKSLWMDAVSKQKTIEKAQAMIERVGYPDYFDDENMTQLEEIYAEYNFNSSYIQNGLLLLQLKTKLDLQLLDKPVNRQEWTRYGPTTVTAFYEPLINAITFPAAFLQTPFFRKDAPNYLNYGMIGYVVGHEITHGFDDERRHFDKDGKRYTLWSNKTNDRFHKRSKCIVEQYNNYTISQIDRQVNGNKTLDENIADNDGLKKAFYAYQNWVETHKIVEKKLPGLTKYSAEQMFFISFGQSWCSGMSKDIAEGQYFNDEHSPNQFRVIGPTSNFAEFDRVFDCKPGQGNSRVNKCNVW